MIHVLRFVPALGAAVLLCAPAAAQSLYSQRVGTGFSSPTFATSAPGSPNTLYVVQQGGLIRPLDTTTGATGGTFLNLPSVIGASNILTGGERGLLGLAFHPNYAGTGTGQGLFYVYYTAPGVTMVLVVKVDEFKATGGVVDPASRRNIITFDAHKDNNASNHNAGWIGFNPAAGPTGGNLYVMTGDSGSGNDPLNLSQNTNSLQGKVLRLDVNTSTTNPTNNYAIPAGNMTGAGVRPELFAYGLRNPYRASFDRATGDLYIGDVGQGSREEIDFIPNTASSGKNFGWRVREGRVQNPAYTGVPTPAGAVDPIYDYNRPLGRSVTGGYVYRGPNAQLDGTYLFGDYVDKKIYSFRYAGTDIPTDGALDRTAELQAAVNGGTIDNISSFAEDGFGNLYVIDYGGEVFRIVPVPEPGAVGLAAVLGVAAWLAARRRASISCLVKDRSAEPPG